MFFTWQSWGDHIDIAQAALMYVILLLAIYVYCQFAEQMSHQVIIIPLIIHISMRVLYTVYD